jgi:flagellar FliL protein
LLEEVDKRMPIIKDAIIDVISSKTSDFVRTPEGREALRLELIRRLNIIIGRRWCPKHILY